MDKIKLVIWDLDETFWDGTLSEGEVEFSEFNVQLIKNLTSRGIVNSICSKNDFDTVKQELEKVKLWDYFIFPHIEWGPKGLAVRDIISSCQFRPENVLFIDDNIGNLEEVKYYNEGIHAVSPDFIERIIEHKAFKGKDDKMHKRLSDYKLLEKKHKIGKGFESNLSFLQQSEIKIRIIQNGLLKYVDRILELIERTNQLNFTKNRVGYDRVVELLNDDNFSCGLIEVHDKYGDYGKVGFYALDKISNSLDHFIFSCRILNLGIEQYVYQWLRFPKISISGEVSGNLNNNAQNIDYIKLVTESVDKKNTEIGDLNVFFKGGCDLSQILISLESYQIDVTEESTFTSEHGLPQHTDHTTTILNSALLDQRDKDYLIKSAFPLSEDYFTTKLFERAYDVVVISILMDYTQRLYQSKYLTGKKFPFGSFYRNDLSSESEEKSVIKWFRRKSTLNVSEEYLKEFRNNFESTGPIRPIEFVENLDTILELLLDDPLVIIINGAEINLGTSEIDGDLASKRHKEMNKALDDWLIKNPKVKLLDVREFVNSIDDLNDSIRHYSPEVYRALSLKILSIVRNWYGESSIKKSNLGKRIFTNVKRLIRRK
ncbi:HAD-IIIC family phosphatase [Candidatus Saccharibacteria bacterium]|nr:HAD-IIIC family phosphatase [Candidatus Saccharibacteria bacterium]